MVWYWRLSHPQKISPTATLSIQFQRWPTENYLNQGKPATMEKVSFLLCIVQHSRSHLLCHLAALGHLGEQTLWAALLPGGEQGSPWALSTGRFFHSEWLDCLGQPQVKLIDNSLVDKAQCQVSGPKSRSALNCHFPWLPWQFLANLQHEKIELREKERE